MAQKLVMTAAKKPAAAPAAVAPTAAKKATAPPPKSKTVISSGQAVENPTRPIAVKDRGLYVPNVYVTEFQVPGIDVLNVPSESPFDYVWGVYGDKGWGKSSFSNLFGLDEDELWDEDGMPTDHRRCLTLMTETLRRGLPIRMVPIPVASLEDLRQRTYRGKYTPWEMCKGYLMAALEDESVRCVCIDNFDVFCQHALNHWLKDESGIDTPTAKNDHGRLWANLKADVKDTLFQVKHAGKGIVLTLHEKRVVTEDPFEGDYYTIQPAVSEWPYAIWRELTDFAIYGTFSSTGRSIFVRGNQFLHASCGTNKRFLYPDAEGKMYPIASFNAGGSPEEAYLNLLKGFRNEQEPENWFSDLGALAEKARKKKAKKD